jgi:hypothetical protein
VQNKKQHITKMPSEDYFKSLEDKILAKTSGNVFHLPLGLAHPFMAPDGYFEMLDSMVLAKTESLSFHLTEGIQHPFKSPEGYFEALDANVFGKLTANSFELKDGINHPFNTPEGYFEGLEELVLSKTKTSSYVLKEDISHPFITPIGYFNDLDKGIYSKTINAKPKSSFQLVWRNYGQYIRIAATLLIVGIFGLGIYSNFNTGTSEELTLSELRTDAIYTYLDEQNLKLDDFETVSDEFAADSFSEINETEMDVYTEDELLELINFQYSNDI